MINASTGALIIQHELYFAGHKFETYEEAFILTEDQHIYMSLFRYTGGNNGLVMKLKYTDTNPTTVFHNIVNGGASGQWPMGMHWGYLKQEIIVSGSDITFPMKSSFLTFMDLNGNYKSQIGI